MTHSPKTPRAGIPDEIWICPSGEQTYSTDEGNSTPELRYVRAALQPKPIGMKVEGIYGDLTHSFSEINKYDVVWNGDGDALAGFYGGYAKNGDYIDGSDEAARFIEFHSQSHLGLPQIPDRNMVLTGALELEGLLKADPNEKLIVVAERVFKAMLSAAPQPPIAGGEE